MSHIYLDGCDSKVAFPTAPRNAIAFHIEQAIDIFCIASGEVQEIINRFKACNMSILSNSGLSQSLPMKGNEAVKIRYMPSLYMVKVIAK